MQYFSCFCILFITIIIICTLDIFFLNKDYFIISDENINLYSDCILILSKEDCPYCSILEDYVKKSKCNSKYTIITFTNEGIFSFDETFITLTMKERSNIIDEVQKIFKKGEVFFPNIIAKNKMYTGLPENKILNNIFNIL